MTPRCNLCGGARFAPHRKQTTGRCAACGSKQRHRLAFAVYQRTGLLAAAASPPYGRRVLHLAPEPLLHDRIRDAVGAGYLPADARPEIYPHAQCLRLFLPRDFRVFPAEFFDFVIHNHVLEHIPGSFREHIAGFCRLLKPGGRLIFSVPGPWMQAITREGGEKLATGADRLKRFGQHDHLKRFGRDLPEFLESLEGGGFAWDPLTAEDRAEIGVEPGMARVMLWRKADRAPAP